MTILTEYITNLVRSGGADLTQRQLAVLCLIVEGKERATVKGLAERLLIGKPVVCRALDVLEAAGFARRVKDSNDLRIVYALPLSAGRRHIENLSRKLEELVAVGKRAA